MTPRPALPDDAPAVAAIEAAAAGAPWSEDAVRRTLVAPATLAFVAGDPVRAHLLASAVAGEGEILTLAVHPDARRRGVATALLDALDARWHALGVRTGWLEVRADNEPARALYRARGWTDAGRRTAYYADGTDAIVLRWSP